LPGRPARAPINKISACHQPSNGAGARRLRFHLPCSPSRKFAHAAMLGASRSNRSSPLESPHKLTNCVLDVSISQIDPRKLSQQRRYVGVSQDNWQNGCAALSRHPSLKG
jgi:hypothetical protein